MKLASSVCACQAWHTAPLRLPILPLVPPFGCAGAQVDTVKKQTQGNASAARGPITSAGELSCHAGRQASRSKAAGPAVHMRLLCAFGPGCWCAEHSLVPLPLLVLLRLPLACIAAATAPLAALVCLPPTAAA